MNKDVSARNAEIIALVTIGNTYEAVASEFGISRQRVQQILARAGFRLERRPGPSKREVTPPAEVDPDRGDRIASLGARAAARLPLFGRETQT